MIETRGESQAFDIMLKKKIYDTAGEWEKRRCEWQKQMIEYWCSGPLYASDLITIWQCFNKSYICGISTM